MKSLTLLLIGCSMLTLVACDQPTLIVRPVRPPRVMATAAEEAACNAGYHRWAGDRLSWKGRTPVRFQFDQNFPKAFTGAMRRAAATWNQAAGFELFVIAPESHPASTPALDGFNIIYFFSEARDDQALPPEERLRNRAVAATHLSRRDALIKEADILFNGFQNTFSTWRFHLGTLDIERVALHELGHALGLKHVADPNSVMFAHPVHILGRSSRTIDSGARAMLACEY